MVDYGGALAKISRTALGSGPFRRAIMLRRINAPAACGWLKDDFHHFGVTIEHDGERVGSVSAVAKRAPWQTCTFGSTPLKALEGRPIVERASDVGTLIDMRLQCTHMFDLAGLVMAHIRRGEDRRLYEVEVPVRDVVYEPSGPRQIGSAHIKLLKNGELALALDIDGDAIVGPEEYAGRSLNVGFRVWTEAMPLELAEYATILRRAIMVAMGRHIDLDLIDTAAQAPMPPVCQTFARPLHTVHRIKDSTRDFSDARDALLVFDDEAPR